MEHSRFRTTPRQGLPERAYFAGTLELLLVAIAGGFIGAAILIGLQLLAGATP